MQFSAGEIAFNILLFALIQIGVHDISHSWALATAVSMVSLRLLLTLDEIDEARRRAERHAEQGSSS